jgi:hypothetical protein
LNLVSRLQLAWSFESSEAMKGNAATHSPLRLPIVQKQLTIAYGAAELPALVWDSKKFYDARKAAGAAGEFVVMGAPTISPSWKNCGERTERLRKSRCRSRPSLAGMQQTRLPRHRSRPARP